MSTIIENIKKGKYETKAKYPSKRIYQCHKCNLLNRNKDAFCPHCGAELTKARAAFEADYENRKKAYSASVNAAYESFKKDTFEELGITDNPKADILFSKAWDLGRSQSLECVWNWAVDLVELIE